MAEHFAEGAKMQWKVAGAKQSTGEERVWKIEAPTARDAEAIARKNGILVTSVQPSSAAHAAAIESMVATAVADPTPPPVVNPMPRIPLVACAACEHQISLAAITCPKCGHPQQPQHVQPDAPPIAPLGYATPYANARPPRVQTVQQTSKFWKAQIMLAVLTMIAGIGVVVALTQTKGQEGIAVVCGGILIIGGIAWYIFARFMAWWHHG